MSGLNLSKYYGDINGIIPYEIPDLKCDLTLFHNICLFAGFMPVFKQCYCPVFTNPDTLLYDMFSDCHYGGIHNIVDFNTKVAHFEFHKTALPLLSRYCNKVEDSLAVYKYVTVSTDLDNIITYNHERMEPLEIHEVINLFEWCYCTQIINWFTRHVGERTLTFSCE